MIISNIRTFVPSESFIESKKFYSDLGFEILWEGEDLISFGNKDNNFFLQDFYNEEYSKNFMMQMHVKDLDELYIIAKNLSNTYSSVKVNDIFEADYGRTFHLIGPSGELWHMTETK